LRFDKPPSVFNSIRVSNARPAVDSRSSIFQFLFPLLFFSFLLFFIFSFCPSVSLLLFSLLLRCRTRTESSRTPLSSTLLPLGLGTRVPGQLYLVSCLFFFFFFFLPMESRFFWSDGECLNPASPANCSSLLTCVRFIFSCHTVFRFRLLGV